MFRAGRRYRHICAKDLDIHVLKVQYVGETYTKLRVYYVNMYTGNILTKANVTLQKSDFEAWTDVKDNAPFTTERDSIEDIDIQDFEIDYELIRRFYANRKVKNTLQGSERSSCKEDGRDPSITTEQGLLVTLNTFNI